MFGGCANNLLSQRAVSCKSFLTIIHISTCIKAFTEFEYFFFFNLTGSQQRVTGFQRSAQITSSVSVCRSKEDALQCGLILHSECAFVLIFACDPLSRFCMEAVLQHRERLSSYWDCLPKHLLHSLKQRMSRVNTLGS